ncbi:LysR family transcriptional regulator [Pseudomonas sp. NPDC078700]|uniref:LysR family transcriptional regulator n=1 Tax=Pseudomonas sp. NPDC078700 TaxID=3364424 RepID=UPI0037C7EFE9
MKQLNDMALFVEVVKAMSFRGAAEATGVPNSTLSRRVSALEKAIGLRLLHRTTRKIELTEAGSIYFERCKRIVAEASLAHEQLGEMLVSPSGVLRVSMPEGFGIIFLAPLIAEFAHQYPGIDFELDMTPRSVDLITEPVDVAIRMGEPPDSNLIARPLARLQRHLYASPEYLARAGELNHPSDLVNHQCLRLKTAQSETWFLHKGSESRKVKVVGRLLLNSVSMIQRLAALHMGIAILAKDIVVNDLASGRLLRVLPEWQATPIPVYAITETRLLPAKTQIFIDFLRDNLKKI